MRINVNKRRFDRLKNLRIFAQEFVEGIKIAKRDKPDTMYVDAFCVSHWIRKWPFESSIWSCVEKIAREYVPLLSYSARFVFRYSFLFVDKHVTKRRIKNEKRGDLMEETGWNTQNYISRRVANV